MDEGRDRVRRGASHQQDVWTGVAFKACFFLKGRLNFHLNEKILSDVMRIFSRLEEPRLIAEEQTGRA